MTSSRIVAVVSLLLVSRVRLPPPNLPRMPSAWDFAGAKVVIFHNDDAGLSHESNEASIRGGRRSYHVLERYDALRVGA